MRRAIFLLLRKDELAVINSVFHRRISIFDVLSIQVVDHSLVTPVVSAEFFLCQFLSHATFLFDHFLKRTIQKVFLMNIFTFSDLVVKTVLVKYAEGVLLVFNLSVIIVD